MNKILILLIFCSGNLPAQTFKASVVDKDSGLPVPDVYVKVLNATVATVTDQQGKFTLKNIPSNATLMFSALGYAHTTRLASDTTAQINMERSSIYLDNTITITARRFEANQFNVSEAVTIVDHRALQHTSPRSTPEALIGTTGVWLQKTNHGGGSPIIRGLVGNQILLMVDGIRMNNATYRYGPNQYLSTIDPGLIERIEATRGNGSVLYGSDALGGVVQIISKTPHFQSGENHLHGRVNARWMSDDMEKSTRAELQWNGEKVAALGGFSIRDFGNIAAGKSLGTLKPTAYKEIASDAKLLVRTGAQSTLTAAWQHHQQSDVPRFDQVTQGGYSVYNFDPQIRQLAYLRWETATSRPLLNSIRMNAALNRSVEGTESQKDGSPEFKDQEDIVRTFSATAEVHSLITNSWQAQSGIEWYHDIVNSNAAVHNLSSNEQSNVRGSYSDGATSTSLAVFSTHTVDIQKLSISAGARFNTVALRVDDATFGNQKISPDALVGTAGIAYNLHCSYRLFVNGNTGFRAPNVDDVSKFGPVESTVFEIPSQDLSPERSSSVEAGFKTNTKIFVGSITAYRTHLSDLIERMPSTYLGKDSSENRRVYQKKNVNESLLRGIEAEGEFKISSALSLYGNFTYTYGKNISKNEPMRRIPPMFGKIGLSYFHASGFWARVDYVSAGKQSRLAKGDLSDARISVRLQNGAAPAWNIVNAYAGYAYKIVSLTVAGQNILDKAYRIYSSGVDGYGRSVSVSFTVKI